MENTLQLFATAGYRLSRLRLFPLISDVDAFPPRQQMSRDFSSPLTSLSRFSCQNKLTNAPACAHKFLVGVASYECAM